MQGDGGQREQSGRELIDGTAPPDGGRELDPSLRKDAESNDGHRRGHDREARRPPGSGRGQRRDQRRAGAAEGEA